MKNSNLILAISFLLIGIITLYMGLNINLECEATFLDNLRAGLPLIIFGIYSLLTSVFLWKKPDMGRSFVAVATLMILFLATAAIFDFSIGIIKTSCT
jgi:hypothetical protein